MEGQRTLLCPTHSTFPHQDPLLAEPLEETTPFSTDSTTPTYPTDLDDQQWAAIAPLIPPGKPLGIARTTSMRAVINAILYRARSGCSWRMLPRDFPHWRTVYGYHRQWLRDGTWQQVRTTLRRPAP